MKKIIFIEVLRFYSNAINSQPTNRTTKNIEIVV